jgi:glycosyltransferase involved in cell wall biosynthesis
VQVTVIIPCLNESLSIEATIDEVRAALPQAEIIVVDNGSTDQTVEIARNAGASILREPSPGKGYAVRRAFTHMKNKSNAVLLIDGDATYQIAPISTALEMISEDGFDMVVGMRVPEAVGEYGERKAHFRIGHAFGNRLLSFLFRRLFKLNVSDTLSGWRLLSPGFYNSFPGGASGFEIEAELNAHAFTLDAAIEEIPVAYRGRLEDSESKLSTYKDGYRILRRNLSLFRSERPSLAYGLLAAPWLIISFYLGQEVLRTYFESGLVPRFPSLIAAVGAFILAGNLWVTGMVLEKVRLHRVAIARMIYSKYS